MPSKRRRGPVAPPRTHGGPASRVPSYSDLVQPSEKDNEKYKKFVRKPEFFHKRQYFVPQLEYTPGVSEGPLPIVTGTSSDKPTPIRGLDIVTFEHVGNPILLFGQPYSGKTSFFLKLCLSSITRFSPKHWVCFVEMRELADLVRSLPKRPKSFLHLLAIHLKTTENELKDIFKPKPCPKSKKVAHCGELFLDGFDEIPAVERDYFWRIIPQLKNGKGECAIRIWISCRSYVKAALSKVFPEYGHFDIVKYTSNQLVDMLHHYWKQESFPNMGKKKEDRMLIFAKDLYDELGRGLMLNFDNGIGCLPMCIELVASLSCHHLGLFLGTKEIDANFPKIYFVELVGKCVMRMIQCYCFKLTASSDDKIDLLDLADKELPKVAELHSKYAVNTYPSYINVIDMNERAGGIRFKQEVHITEQMHRIGLIVKCDLGSTEFHHGTFGDYILAKHFALKGLSLEEKCDTGLDRFYFRKLLFEKGQTGILSYYDYFLGQQDPNHSSRFLHQFLVQHYKLEVGQEEEWDKIKDNGNVWHWAVMQGLNNVARRYLKAFRAEENTELKKFLIMRTPLGILEGNDIEKITDNPTSIRNQHVVSSLSILALFGHGGFVEETLDLFLQVFEPEELQFVFNNQREWSPIHYAAAHVNLWFINGVYRPKFQSSVKMEPGIYSPGGYLPTHLLLTGAWYYYVMEVKDCTLSDYDFLVIDDEEDGEIILYPAKERVDDFRILYLNNLMRKDWRSVALLQTLQKCIYTMVKVGGEDINAFDLTGRTTFLHRAVEEGLLGTTMFLINMERSLNLNVRNIHGVTPMHQAGSKGFKSIFMCLARHGAKATLRDIKGQSAISLWRESGEQLYFSRGGPRHTKPEIAFFKLVQSLDTKYNGNRHTIQRIEVTNTAETASRQQIVRHPDENPDNQVGTGKEVDAPGNDGCDDDSQPESTEAEEVEEEAIEEEKGPMKFDEGQDTEVEGGEDKE